jgi:FkbM family methyltransferase
MNSDIVSDTIINSKRWEGYCTNKILEVLNYYSSKKNIKNEDMYILDIGANVGWYSYYLGKFGYKIISFEPSERNYYILRRTYCLNQEINITIINKGLYNEEKRCDYYEHVGNKGNGMVICDQKKDIPNYLEKKSEVILTKLSNYITFLSTKNLAFIKIDAEGSEESAFLSGIELLTKYHVPFIFLEYCPNNLKLHNVDKKKFLEIFYNNGYKISLNNFLDKNYTSIDYLASKDDLINIYIIYEKIFE